MRVRLLVEVPAGSFVKRSADRGFEFLSPLPCPFTYGCVPDRRGGDGDPVDALLLRERLPAGTTVERPVWAVVDFVDDGRPDEKLVCATSAPTEAELAEVERFFRLYAPARRLLNHLRGRRGETRFRGLRRG